MENTTFGNLLSLSYFMFVNESEEPESPEAVDCNVWQKTSAQLIRKVGEGKKSILRFRRSTTLVFLVAKDLDELIANNSTEVSCKKR